MQFYTLVTEYTDEWDRRSPARLIEDKKGEWVRREDVLELLELIQDHATALRIDAGRTEHLTRNQVDYLKGETE